MAFFRLFAIAVSFGSLAILLFSIQQKDATQTVALTVLSHSATIPVTWIVLTVAAITSPGLLVLPGFFSQMADVEIGPVGPAIFCVAGLLGAGAMAHQISFVSAALILGLGCGTFAVTWLLSLMLLRGESIELESRWSGLGGSLGGWRLSRAASFFVLMLALVAGTVASVQPPQKEGTGRTTADTSDPKKPARQADGSAEEKAGKPPPDPKAQPAGAAK